MGKRAGLSTPVFHVAPFKFLGTHWVPKLRNFSCPRVSEAAGPSFCPLKGAGPSRDEPPVIRFSDAPDSLVTSAYALPMYWFFFSNSRSG